MSDNFKMLWIDIDTLRPDHLGCYGYERPTSPNIDQLAKEGLRLEALYTSDSPCLPSRSALQTGMFGIHTGAVGHGGTAADPFSEGLRRGFQSPRAFHSFASVLSRKKIWTATISVFAQRHSAMHWYAGFNEVIQDGYNTYFSEGVTPHALEWLKRNAKRDSWFLHVHVWDPHTPYTASEEMAENLGGQRPNWITQEILEKHQTLAGPHSASETLGFDPDSDISKYFSRFPLMSPTLQTLADVDRMFDGYDTGIMRADNMVGKLVNELDEQGVIDETAVVVSSDHGENFGELGVYCDHQTADEYTHHLPGVIKWPGLNGASQGGSDKGKHYQVDLAASVLELAGAEVPESWDGVSFADSLKDGTGQEDGTSGRDALVLSAAAWTVQRSLRWENWLYMYTRHDGYHCFPEEMLFNLDTDPHLLNDLAETEPQIAASAAKQLAKWKEEMLSSSIHEMDPHDIVLKEGGPFHIWGQLPAYIERLRATGREPIAKDLAMRYPEAAAGRDPKPPWFY